MVFSQFGMSVLAGGTIVYVNWGINLGSSWSNTTSAYGLNSFPPLPGGKTLYQTSYTVVVQTATSQAITHGAYINTTGTGATIKCWGITATRIA